MKKGVEEKVKVEGVVLEEKTYVKSKVVGSVSDSATAKKKRERETRHRLCWHQVP